VRVDRRSSASGASRTQRLVMRDGDGKQNIDREDKGLVQGGCPASSTQLLSLFSGVGF
jgi:hypothetical protein